MKNYIILLMLFYQYSFAQISSSKFEVLPFEFVTNIVISSQSGSSYKSFMVNQKEVASVLFNNGDLLVNIGEENLHAIPEKYHIGITLIKQKDGKVIGMSKKYSESNTHIVGIGNRIFKIERLKTENQFKLWELQDGKSLETNLPKLILVTNKKSKMQVFHNLNNIPLAAIPFLINTTEIDKKVNKKVIGGLLLATLITAIKILPTLL